MTLSTFIEKLNLPEQTVFAVRQRPLPPDHHDLKTSFFEKSSHFMEFAKSDPDGLTVLCLYLHWAAETMERYGKMGIPEKYFWASMKDIAIWCEDYLEKYGVPGLQEWEWVGRSLRLEVFRIGRLQFEPRVLKQSVEFGGQAYPSGTATLEVHIPAGEPLDTAEALAAMQQAPAFFLTYFGSSYRLFHCHSWLLSPDLRKFLPEHSRIMRFQDLFSVYKTDTEERQAEERIFGFLSEDPNAYPETTSLQKAAKEYMLAGQYIPMGSGIRAIE